MPVASVTTASAGAVRSVPIFSILPFFISIEVFCSTAPVPVCIVPFLINVLPA